MTVVGGASTLLIGLYLFDEIIGVMPTPEQEGLANATNTTIATTGQAFTLGGVALVVLMASVMLVLISGGFGGGGRGGQPPRGGTGGVGGTPPMH